VATCSELLLNLRTGVTEWSPFTSLDRTVSVLIFWVDVGSSLPGVLETGVLLAAPWPGEVIRCGELVLLLLARVLVVSGLVGVAVALGVVFGVTFGVVMSVTL
jgi:hypothetical protein